MENCGDAKSVDWFFEAAGTKEGINFMIFALQRSANWRVMQNHDSAIGLQLHQRLLQANGMADLFLHELFNQRLAPRVQHPPAETAAETTDSRKSNTSDFDGFAIEHGHTSVVENLGDRFRMSGFIIVIPDDSDDRNSHRAANIGGEFFYFLWKPVLRGI